MAGRSRDTYKKRQKEVARAEKKQEKLARRVERKKQGPDGVDIDIEAPEIDVLETDAFDADGNPVGGNAKEAAEPIGNGTHRPASA
jgi:hypothetical protein